MNGGKSLSRKIREEPVAFVFSDEIGEFVVPAVDHAFADKSPLADVYPLVGTVHPFVGKGISVDDVFGKDITCRSEAGGLAF